MRCLTTLVISLGLCIAPCLSIRQNPLIPGFNPDPSPIYVDGWYYLATSSFEYLPGIPIYRSRDLSNWDLFSHALTRPSQLQLYGTPTSGGAWAPTLSHTNGTFYLTSMTRWTYDPVAKVWPRMSWVHSQDLTNWSDPVWAEPWGIDPELFHDPQSNKTFLNLMAPNNNDQRLWGVSQCEVDLGSGQCIGPYNSMWNGTLPHNATARPEGPKTMFRGGWYYLLIAEGGTDLLHRSSVARSKSPQGPWDPAPNNPILYNGHPDNGNLTVQSTGHGTFIETPDNRTYIVFLARRNVNGASPLGRETFIGSVEWDEEGWPVVNGGKPILLSDEILGLPDKIPTTDEQTDTFAGTSLDASWYTLRTPYTEIYTLAAAAEQGGSGLIFAPNVFNLSDRDVPAAILRKQTSLNMSFSALTIPLPELAPGQAVGVSAYLSELAHHDIAYGLCRHSRGSCVFTSLIRNGSEIYDELPLPSSPTNSTTTPISIEFHVRASPLEYALGFNLKTSPAVAAGVEDSDSASEVKWLTTFPSSYLAFAPPGWFVFEGAMFALFATGNGRPWGRGGARVGFAGVRERLHGEDIPDFDDWA